MAVVPSQPGPPRGKAAARPRTDEYPRGIIALIFTIVDSRERTNNCIRLFIGCCVVAYTLITAYNLLAGMKGVHAQAWHLILPGGVFSGATLTYVIRRVKLWFRRRHDSDEGVGTPPTGH
jgi:hypothetical protein